MGQVRRNRFGHVSLLDVGMERIEQDAEVVSPDAADHLHRRGDGVQQARLVSVERLQRQCGIVELDQDGKVRSFEEKPERPSTDLANAGVMVMDTEVLSFFPDIGEFDLGHDLLPRLAGHMYGKAIDEYLQDIGTFEKYLSALRNWRGFDESRAGNRSGQEVTGESS